MGPTSLSNVAASGRTGGRTTVNNIYPNRLHADRLSNNQAQNVDANPNNPMTAASSSTVPSRIPQPTRPPKDRAARQKVPGYAAPTAASSQRQLPRIRPQRSAPKGSAGTALPKPPAKHVAEGFVSKIPTRTKTRIETLPKSTLHTTPARAPQSSMQPTPIPPPIPNSPPPQYAERSETPMHSYLANLVPSLRPFSPRLRSPPPYLRHPSELELEIYIPPYAYEDESEEIVARLLESLPDSLPESSLVRGFRFKPVFRRRLPAIEALDESRRSVIFGLPRGVGANEPDELARTILEDIKSIMDASGFPIDITYS
ncbi:hypothetical protein FRC11_008709 [Ceratobasidium sp. 423]|nr:hypothetical protein FRC11_008709 [Ceratobasidium sp. 423]